MRALRLLFILSVLLAARPGHGGMTDPTEIIENSQVETSTMGQIKEGWETVKGTVKKWWTTNVDKVLDWSGTKTAETAPPTTNPDENQTSATATAGTTTESLTPTETATQSEIEKATNPGTDTAGSTATDSTTGGTTVIEATPTTAEATLAPATPPATGTASTPTPVDTREAKISALKSQLTGIGSTPKANPKDFREARRQLKKEGLTHIAVPGRKGKSKLTLSKAGVPLSPVLGRVKKIPRLDIGQEPTLTRTDFMLKERPTDVTAVQEIKPLPTPTLVGEGEVKKVTSQKVVVAEPAKDLEKSKFGIDKIVSHETISKAVPKIGRLEPIQERPYRELSEPQLTMLTALILYNKGDQCPVLLGLFHDLAKNEKYATESTFLLGQCANRLKMHTLAFEQLSTLIRSENQEFGKEAIKMLATELPAEYEIPFAKLIRDLKDKKLIAESVQNEVQYLAAKGSYKEGQYQEARLLAEKVPATSNRYGNAQFIVGLSWYALGNTTKAIGRFEELRGYLAKQQITDKNLNSLTAINLARLKFTQGDYKGALNYYMAVDKDHPVWVQGLTEQGWTQLALEDFSGAIGNMYSLHSPYFKSVYKPESFVVRTIGYLNICQYGDAYRTLTWLEREYRPWSEAVSRYTAEKKLASDYYETAREYLKGASDRDVNGLPYQVIREMARQRNFLNAQGSLNAKADEVGRYENVDKEILREREKLKTRILKATARFKELKTKLARAEKDRALAPQVDGWRQQLHLERDIVIGLRHLVTVLDQSRKSYTQLQTQTLARLEKERYNLRETAGRSLVTSLQRIKSEASLVLENNEFLRYEVFAGSGENIRYQVAGGQVAEANRVPASVTPTKLMNWNFDGEYWEDEIGSYRSGLKNNCPQTGRMSEFFKNRENKSDKKDGTGQAALEKGVGK